MSVSPTDYDRERLRCAPKMRSVRVGDLTATYLPDGVCGLKPRGWLCDTTESDWQAHANYVNNDGYLVAGIGALLVQHEDRSLLIDAGVGPIDAPADPRNPLSGPIRGGELLANLARAGVSCAGLDAVAVSHLHIDHVGGAFHPDFTARRYLVSDVEWKWWRNFGPEERARHAGWAQRSFVTGEMLDHLEPKVETVSDGDEIFPGVRMHLTGGHTRGHASFVLTSRGERLVAFGDALHSPLQVRNPQWGCRADLDQADAKVYRQQLVDDLAASGDLACGGHFADVVFGRVHRDHTGATKWVPHHS